MRFNLGPDLGALKEAAFLVIDQAAERTRLKFITTGSGQALEYGATEREALEFLLAEVNGTPSPANYPFLNAEILAIEEATGATASPHATAMDVAQEAAMWNMVGSMIKRIRRSSKMRVELATTPAEIRSVVDGIVWP